jgi:hypothetical protein
MDMARFTEKEYALEIDRNKGKMFSDGMARNEMDILDAAQKYVKQANSKFWQGLTTDDISTPDFKLMADGKTVQVLLNGAPKASMTVIPSANGSIVTNDGNKYAVTVIANNKTNITEMIKLTDKLLVQLRKIQENA